MYDVVSAKTVVPPEDSGILDVTTGMICRVSYTDGCYYKAKIVDKGKLCDIHFTKRNFVIMHLGSNMELRKKQKQMEKELDQEAEVLSNYYQMYIVLTTMDTNWVELTIGIYMVCVCLK